jgi:transposase
MPDAGIAALRALLAERDAVLAERDAELRNAGFEIEKLKVQLAALRRDKYGQSSEKLAAEIGQLEMLIGDAEEDAAQAAARAEAKARAKGQPGQPRRPAIRKPLPEHLPRETVLHEPVFACRCGCTDPKRLTELGEEVTEVLEKIPARLKVIRHVRPRYACRACETVLQSPAPDLPVEKGRPGPSRANSHFAVSQTNFYLGADGGIACSTRFHLVRLVHAFGFRGIGANFLGPGRDLLFCEASRIKDCFGSEDRCGLFAGQPRDPVRRSQNSVAHHFKGEPPAGSEATSR